MTEKVFKKCEVWINKSTRIHSIEMYAGTEFIKTNVTGVHLYVVGEEWQSPFLIPAPKCSVDIDSSGMQVLVVTVYRYNGSLYPEKEELRIPRNLIRNITFSSGKVRRRAKRQRTYYGT